MSVPPRAAFAAGTVGVDAHRRIDAPLLSRGRSCARKRTRRCITSPMQMASFSDGASSERRPLASRLASGGLKCLIRTLCDDVTDLRVDVDAATNRQLLAGHLRGVSISASGLSYGGVRVSGGAALYTDAIELAWGASRGSPSLARPFSVSARLALTAADINRSPPVRAAFQTLLAEVVRGALSGAVGRLLPRQLGGLDCALRSVELRERAGPWSVLRLRALSGRGHGGRIILHASAKFGGGQELRFAVETSLAIRENGRVVALDSPMILWRGIPIPLPVAAVFGIELGPEALLTSVVVSDGVVAADGIVVVNPPHRNSMREVATERRALKGKETPFL